MTSVGRAILELQRSLFEKLQALERTAPSDVDAIVTAIVAHLRSWRPVSIAPLGTLGPPTEPIRDPRDDS